jgi:hypothetical protein
MWGTTPPCAKLTGDSGSGFELGLIGDCRLFRLPRKISRSVFWEFCNTIPATADLRRPGRANRRTGASLTGSAITGVAVISSDIIKVGSDINVISAARDCTGDVAAHRDKIAPPNAGGASPMRWPYRRCRTHRDHDAARRAGSAP